jgi:cytochrome c oxidase subunit 2
MAVVEPSEFDQLWRVFVLAAVVVGGIVVALIAWPVLRYRRRGRDDLPPQFEQHVPLEILYTVIPVAIVAVLFALTYRTEKGIENLDPEPAVTIDVTGFTWSWRFEYQGTSVTILGRPDAPPTLVIPAGLTVRIRGTSTDVIHAFFVPETRFKRDLIPGRTTEFDLRMDEPGVYGGHCAEYCGLDHARMTFYLRVIPADDFDAWLAREAAA